MPSKPHEDVGCVAQSLLFVPAGSGAHVPGLPAWLQDSQSAAQAEAQQTPSTHKVLSHSPPAAQGCPFVLGPSVGGAGASGVPSADASASGPSVGPSSGAAPSPAPAISSTDSRTS